jgi:glutamate 5-kinase
MKQYLQLFKYLKEFAKLRNKVISDIDSSDEIKFGDNDTLAAFVHTART